MLGWIRHSGMVGAALALLACSGTATRDFPSDGGSGGSGGTGTGTGTAGSGGVDCNCAVGAYVPVCGIDGTTYDAACGIECVPVEVECSGECPCVDCDELQELYQAALGAARACSPFIDMEQCTAQVGSELACPCPTYVNPENTAALSTLAELQSQWAAAGCGDDVGCPAVECEVPIAALCEPQAGSGDTGRCVDEFGVSGDS